jgi:hypothetical protein
MAPLGFIEILDPRGHVAERIRVDSFPVHLGRAYHNEVVLNDPYVCPVHARIESDEEGRLLARDLDSVNGLRAAADGARVKELELHSGTQFRVGRTTLRYCGADHPLAPTLIDREEKTYAPAAPYVAIVPALIVFLLLTLESFLSSIEHVTVAKIVSEPLITLSLLLFWSGLWSLAGRIVVSHFHFSRHVAVACGAVLAFSLLTVSAEWTEFMLPAFPALWIAGVFGSAGILAALVYGHLCFASTLRRRSRLWASLLVSCAAIGLSMVIDFANRSRFSNVMEYNGLVKPLDAAWLPANSIDEFIEKSHSIREELDALALKARAGQP